MTTASIVIYKTDEKELEAVVRCASDSIIDIIYIVDNSPTNSLENIAKSFSPKVVYIPSHSNPGYGAAHNIAIRQAIESNATYHAVLNPDIVFDKNVITELANYMDTDKQAGLIMPKIIYPNGDLQYLCKLLPTPLDWIGRRFSPFKKEVEKRNRIFELRDTGYNKIMSIPFLSGCFMFFRIDTLREVGLFDEKIFMYGEDTDITRRIYSSKYDAIFYPNVHVIHVHKKESHKNYRLLWIHIKAAIYYFNKWGWLFDKERRKINREVKENYLD